MGHRPPATPRRKVESREAKGGQISRAEFMDLEEGRKENHEARPSQRKNVNACHQRGRRSSLSLAWERVRVREDPGTFYRTLLSWDWLCPLQSMCLVSPSSA